MTRFALCIARPFIARTTVFELAGLRHRRRSRVSTMNRVRRLLLLTGSPMPQRIVTLPIVRGAGAVQLLTAADGGPFVGPAAEPPTELPSVTASRRLHIAPADISLVAASGAPLAAGDTGPRRS
jgi:hypothetical protein